MQMAVIEFAKNVLKLEDANSTEMKQHALNPVIDMMQEQKTIVNMGGTMRLGSYACAIKENTVAHAIYGETNITERHRHRYEFNNKYLQQYTDNGMIASGFNPDSNLVEIIEIPTHKFFVGVQFHPEFKSTILKPHPVFCAFVKACLS
jgi:CTP synthase